MTIDLSALIAGLPKTWSSTLFARIGSANLRVLKMDNHAVPEEWHDYPECLLVMEGEMHLVVNGQPMTKVMAGQAYVVEPGIVHSVAPGSFGTLLIVDIN